MVTPLQTGCETATSREHQFPSPQRVRGAGGEGDTSLAESISETRLRLRISECLPELKLCARPSPLSPLGRGESRSIECFARARSRHYVLQLLLGRGQAKVHRNRGH